MIDNKLLKEYYAKSKEWEQELVRNFDLTIGLTEKEARVLVHLWRNKGSYVSRIARLPGLKRTTIVYILQRLTQQQAVFTEKCPVSGLQVYKLSNSDKTKALLAASFKLCVCAGLKNGVVNEEVFN